MPKATDLKNCIKCGDLLTDANWRKEARANYINKCSACVKIEKREYHKAWRKKHPGAASEISKRHKTKLRETDPILARARDAYEDCKKRSVRVHLEMDLTRDFVVTLMRTTQYCPYFGWPLTFSVGKERTLASLDRIDSSRGYTQDNVRVVSYLANLMKSYATEEELIRFAKGVLAEHDDSIDAGMLGLGAMRSVEKVKGAEGNR